MAQIITTNSNKVIYTPIASIKQYNEPDFEKKLLRYSGEIFSDFYILKGKFEMTSDLVSNRFEPDLILISKSFKKWVIIEVELCQSPKKHTIDQVKCFANPKFDSRKLYKYLSDMEKELQENESEVVSMLENIAPDFIVVLDDYSDDVFRKFRNIVNNLKICVLEVYRTTSHPYEAFRFGGDYPYELSNSSKLKWINSQHYQIMKEDFAAALPSKLDLKFDMDPINATVISSERRPKKYYLKIPEHNIPEDHYLQIGITIKNEYVLQRF